MRVYSLNAKQGDPRYLQAAQGNYWFWQRGYDVVGFEREQLHAGELDADLIGEPEHTLVCGSVAVVRDALIRVGRVEPPNLDFPPCLAQFVGRKFLNRPWDKFGVGNHFNLTDYLFTSNLAIATSSSLERS